MNCEFRRLEAPIRTLGLAAAHHRGSCFQHDGLYVCEVEIDKAGPNDQVGDAFDGPVEHFIRLHERVGGGRVLVGHQEQIFVGDDHDRMDGASKLVYAVQSHVHPPLAFEGERFRNHADGHNSKILR